MPCMDTLFEECRCELSTCPFTVCRIKLAKLHPRQAVAEARQESAASPFVLKIATATLRDARYRRSDAATMFIRHILEGDPTDGEAPHWDYPVLGLFNVFASIDADKSGYRDAVIKREILNAYPKIMEVVSRDIDLLSGPEANIERRRAIVCGLIAWCTTETVMQKTMYDEYSLKIVIHCWLQSPPPDQNRRSIAMVPIEQVLHPYAKAGPCYKPPPNHVYDTIQSFGMTTFVSLVSSRLKNKKLWGEPLQDEIRILRFLMEKDDRVFWALIRNKVHKQLIHTIRRQTKRTEFDESISQGVIGEAGFLFLETIIEHDAEDVLFRDLFLNTHIAEIGIISFKHAWLTGCTCCADGWYGIFDMIRTRMTCQCNECTTTLTDGFVLAARMSLERLSMEAVSSLQEEVHINKKYITVVREVMSLLKVTPQSILERSMYQREKRCCNRDCPELKAGLRPVKKYTCTGCHAVLYCGSECQKGDWAYHKTQCKILAGNLMIT